MPFDPDAYLAKKKFDPDAYLAKGDQPAEPGSGLMSPVDIGKGFVKGLGRYAVGAGQIAEDLAPGAAAFAREIPGVASAAHAAKEFTTSGNKTWGESVGDVGGTAVPWIAGAATGVDEAAGGAYLASKAAPYLGRAAPFLGELAAKAGFGAAGGGLEATKKGDLSSHLQGAEYGAGAGAVTAPRVLGPAAGLAGATVSGYGVEQLAHHLGWTPVLMALGSMGLGGAHHGLHHLGLLTLARRAAELSRKPGAWIAEHLLPGGLVGGEAGAASGESSDGK